MPDISDNFRENQSVENSIVSRNGNESVFYDLLEIMGFVVFERIGSSVFKISGNLPEWFITVFGAEPSVDSTFAPEDISPFVDNFFPVAQQFWKDNK
ncbi:MAG: hypothetical protein V1897_03950, partial [Pseudomonadota bacterium]